RSTPFGTRRQRQMCIRDSTVAAALAALSLLLASPARGAQPSHAVGSPEDSLLAAARAEHWAGNEEIAIPVFRNRLVRHPEDRATRLDLANALAWSGDPDAAIPLYEDLLRQSPADRAVLRARTNALRWAGRSGEALESVRRLRRLDPEDEDLRSLERSLARECDPAVRASVDFFEDSGEVSARAFAIHGRLDTGPATAWTITAGSERLTRDGAGAPGPGESAGESASETERQLLQAGTEIATGPRSSIAFEAGVSIPGAGSADGACPRLRAVFRSRPLARASLQAAAAFADRGYEQKSVAAEEAGLRGVDGSLSGYLSFSPRAGLYMRLRAGSWDDENAFRSSDVALDAKLAGPLRAALAAQWTGYSRGSSLYYAPRDEWTAAAWIHLSPPLPAFFSLDASGWFGAVGNRTGSGEAGGGKLAFRAPIASSLDAVATGEISATRRISRYESRSVRLALEWRH
ncbi:MAG: tetratricopeptide repeat protein, partial [Candidatus Eisenbacteria bacterium]|nr:tetratricopeptide repeat protein [Candidatus Eisenbacteria bacterium]